MKTITLHNQEISYILKRSRRSRNMSLKIDRSGELVASAHPLIPEFLIRQFIKSKASWILEKIAFVKEQQKNKIVITDKKQKQEIKEKAIVSVLTKVKKWNEAFGFEIKKITVKEQKTCWGSCTRSKHLNFNWKLGLVPDHLVDYVVVHELCHLQHLNHSKRFWDLVATRIPDYKKSVKELRQIGLNIT